MAYDAEIELRSKSGRRIAVSSDGAHLALRIVARSLNLKSEVYGVAFLGEDGRGSQADVFFGEVANQESIGANVSTMLGHVIAHELGKFITRQQFSRCFWDHALALAGSRAAKLGSWSAFFYPRSS